MEPAEMIAILRRYRAAVGVVVLVAIAMAIVTVYHVSGSGLEPRASTSGIATAQVLIDAPKSAIGDLKQDTAPLVARAGVFAQLMASTNVRDEIARTAGIAPQQLVTAGPFPGANDTNPVPPPSSARGDQVLGELAQYRLDFSTQPDLPLLTIVAKAPDAGAAARLADAAATGLRASVSDLQRQQDVAPDRRVVVRGLGAAQARTVSDGPGKAMGVLTGLAVLFVGLVAIAGVGWSRQARLLAAEEQRSLQGWPVTPAALDDEQAPAVEQRRISVPFS